MAKVANVDLGASESVSGVYLIEHGEVALYVGSSVNVLRRLKEHRRDLLNSHPNKYLARYLKNNKISLDDLTFSVLEMSDLDLLKKEQRWHNVLLPKCANAVPHLATASDEFKLFIFERVLQMARFH